MQNCLILCTLVSVLGLLGPFSTATNAAEGHFSKYSKQANKILAQMTLAEKVGQMTQAELGHLKDLREIAELNLGSVLSGGGSDPKEGNELGPWTDTYDNCQKQALSTRLGIPLLYGIDAVHGHNNVLNAVIFPHNIGLGCTRDAKLVEEISRITALEVRASGINWTFAPCVTVPRDIRWGRTFEGYGEDPQLVGELGAAAVRGLQGADLSDPHHILGCAKHYVGDGGTKAVVRAPGWEGFGDDVRLRLDQGDMQSDEERLRRIHLAPYLPSIQAGVGTIMPSYSSWNGVKCSANKYLLTDVLKEELGFDGFLISDYKAIDQITDDYREAIKISVNAGMDMFMVPGKYGKFIPLLIDLVEKGEVSESRIDDAVRRILRVKIALGLFDPKRSHLADRSLHQYFGIEKHRQVAREAVQKSLVLLKNEKDVLPLSKTTRIQVIGQAANDIGLQCGGWTIEWQGAEGPVTTGGTTILDGLREVAGESSTIGYSEIGSEIENADLAIVVIAEKPYAEGNGDDGELDISNQDQTLLNQINQSDVPKVLIVLSGRPIILGEALENFDAVVAAWLPGTEGTGIADVIFGDVPPTGKLSATWPKTIDQEPINKGDADYQPAFSYGFGLSY